MSLTDEQLEVLREVFNQSPPDDGAFVIRNSEGDLIVVSRKPEQESLTFGKDYLYRCIYMEETK